MSAEQPPDNGAISAPSGDQSSTFSMRKFAPLLVSLYVTQYVGVGFLFVGISAILREQGLGLTEIGTLQFAGVLWVLKFLYAPLVDRFGMARLGHYRSWLLIMQFLLAVAVGAMAFVRPSVDTWQTLFYIAIFMVAFSATQDIATDAINVRIVPEEQKSIASGIQTIGGYLGNIIGGGVTLLVYGWAGWIPAIGLMVALIVGTWIMVFFLKEPPRQPSEKRSAGYKSFVSLMKNRHVRTWILLVLPLQMAGVGMAYALMTPSLVDAGWSVTSVGILLAVAASVPATLGGLINGWALRRFGYVSTFVGTSIMAAIALVLLLVFFNGNVSTPLIVAWASLYMTGQAMMGTVANTVNLRMARDDSAGSDFTLMSSVSMLTSYFAGPLGLVMADYSGYFNTGLVALGLFVVGVAVSIWYFVTQWPAWEAANRSATHAEEPVAIAE